MPPSSPSAPTPWASSTRPCLGSPLYGYPWSFWVCLWLAAAASALLGVMIGAPTLRVRGDYLAIITLGFGEIIPVAIRNLGDVTIQIGDWRPVDRLNLTGGENGVNPIGRPYLPGVPFETDPVPWYFLILVIGALSIWAMTRLRDSRLGRAWMAVREDETAADCTGVNPIATKLLAFGLGAWFSGFAGIRLRRQAPGHHAGRVRVPGLDHAALHGRAGRRGQHQGRDPRRDAHHPLRPRRPLPDHVLRALGGPLRRHALPRHRRPDALALVLLRPRPRRRDAAQARGAGRPARRPATPDDDELAVAEESPAPRVEAAPVWLRERTRSAAGVTSALLEVRGVSKRFGGLVAVNEVDL
jgi:hypothetical protein